jgi:hypothetical protein
MTQRLELRKRLAPPSPASCPCSLALADDVLSSGVSVSGVPCSSCAHLQISGSRYQSLRVSGSCFSSWSSWTLHSCLPSPISPDSGVLVRTVPRSFMSPCLRDLRACLLFVLFFGSSLRFFASGLGSSLRFCRSLPRGLNFD